MRKIWDTVIHPALWAAVLIGLAYAIFRAMGGV